MTAVDSCTVRIAESGPRTVLIVDDDEEVRHVLRLMCDLEGFEVVGEASSGIAALPLALNKQPGFVILDVLMPGRGGDAMSKLLRSLAPDTKIVAFYSILESKPPWSDFFLNKERIARIAPSLEHLLS